ncbi:MAG: YeeE/YedE family protein [Thermodesulfovibrionales bacterium]
MHRSDFCIAGAFRDIFLTRDLFRLRALFLLVCVTSVLVYLGRSTGLITSYPPSFFGAPSPMNLAAGMIFGIGMVLAGGCVTGTLYKMGTGNFISLFAFGGLLFGTVLFGFVYPFYRPYAEALVPGVTFTALEHFTGILLPVGILLLLSFFFLFQNGRIVLAQNSYARGYLDPWKAAVIIAFLILISFIVTGRPLSVTAGLTKIADSVAERIMPAHRGFVGDAPIRFFYGEAVDRSNLPGLDPVVLTQIPMIFGIVAGSFFSSLLLGEFSLRPFPPLRQVCSGFFGGTLMGCGSLMAGGCTVWHFMGGLPLLVFQSLLFTCGVVFGAFIGSRILVRTILKLGEVHPFGNHSS